MLIDYKLKQLTSSFKACIISRNITANLRLAGITPRLLKKSATFCVINIKRAYHPGNCIQEHVSRKKFSPQVRKEFDFSAFYRAIRQKGFFLPCDTFLSWFIGFTEGDGSFVIIKRGKVCIFVITQSCNDREILYYIQKNLGFGRVHKQGARTYRFVVQDRANLYILFSLFNGNLVFPRQKAQFMRWVEWAGLGSCKKLKNLEEKDPIIHSEILPSLENGWISGITDSEGCFTASFLSNSNAFRLRFILSQKGDDNLPVLSHLIYLFQGGSIEAHSIKGNYSYILSGVKNCYKIYKYFSLFSLKSKKRESLHLWKSLHVDILRKRHLDPNKRSLLSEKAKRINSIKRKSK